MKGGTYMLRRLLPLLIFFPVTAPAVSREMQELMRDIALLQQQVKDLQQSQDTKFAALTVLAQQTLDSATKANTAVAVLESGLRGSMQEQLKGVVTSAVGVGSRVDSLGSDVQAVRASLEDVNTRLGKLQQQLVDLNKAIQALAAPPAPPPPAPGTTTSSQGGPPPNLPPASALYDNARRDASSQKYDLALQEFQDYLKYYKDTELAPNAQFYIGYIHFNQNDLESALADFDAVLEKYSDNNKTPDAMLMKGKTLVKMGKPTQGANEFREVAKRYPRTDQATQAIAELKKLGLPYNQGGSTTRRKGSR
jgi:tol-pal system protein YbgF